MKFILYRDAIGDWRWTLIAPNGEKLGDSGEGYKRKIDCKASIRLVQQSGEAIVVERKP